MIQRKILITVFAILFGLTFTTQVKALFDPADLLTVTSPLPLEKVKGTKEISWIMFDNDQSTIKYSIKLFDPETCGNKSYGEINTNIEGSSNKSSANTVNWNTKLTKTTANLEDGRYCLQLCGVFKKEESSYTACDARIISIVNSNRLPQITSSPTKTQITLEEKFSYQIKATDPDNDTLTYRLVQTPEFLDINANTGLIESNSKPKLPSGVSTGEFKIMVGVDDGISGEVYQRFTLQVTGGNGGENNGSEIQITSPTADSIFNGEENKITAQITEIDGILQVRLDFSSDNLIWKEIKTITENLSEGKIDENWNVTEIPNGRYFVRVVVTDNQNVSTIKVSDQFTIQNNANVDAPLIINVKPENESVVEDSKPGISGEFVPSAGGNIDLESFKIFLNENDISQLCELSETNFVCTLQEELTKGRQSVRVQISDSNNKSTESSWIFSYGQTTQDDSIILFGRSIPKNVLILIIVLICLFSLLFIIPWILYSVWIRNRKRREESTSTLDTSYTTTFDNPTNNDLVYPLPTITTNYYTPTQNELPSGWVSAEPQPLPTYDATPVLPPIQTSYAEPVPVAESFPAQNYTEPAPVAEPLPQLVPVEPIAPPVAYDASAMPNLPATDLGQFQMPSYPEPLPTVEQSTVQQPVQDINANPVPNTADFLIPQQDNSYLDNYPELAQGVTQQDDKKV